MTAEDWPLPKLAKITPRDYPMLEQPTAANGVIRLDDVAEDVELSFQYDPGLGARVEELHMYQITGAGIGVLDFDRDGWPDLYCGQGGGPAFGEATSKTNQMFRNVGGKRFEDVTQQSECADRGYAQGVATGDLNQDGFPDIVVANIGPCVTLINNGDGTFTKQSLKKADQNAWTASVACGDLDGDAIPEIVLVNYIADPAIEQMMCTGREGSNCSPQKFRAAVNEVLRHDARRGWVPWQFSEEGFRPSYGLGILITNIDGQNGNDLYITNDTEPNTLFLSQLASSQDNNKYSLRESAPIKGCSVGLRGNSEGSMGIASGDFDRNGKLDMHITNFANEPSALYLQQDHGIFVNQSIGLGLEESTFPMVGWGTQAADFDNNGWTDIAVLNGHIYSSLPDGSLYQMLPQMFRGGPAGFDLTEPEPASYWSTPRLGRSLVKLDWNRDGLIDLAAVHLDAPVALLQNSSSNGNWIQFELVASESERSAIGARVRVVGASQEWTHWTTAGDGYQSSNEAVLAIGLGEESTIKQVEVSWPSGAQTNFSAPDINQRYLLIENESVAVVRSGTTN